MERIYEWNADCAKEIEAFIRQNPAEKLAEKLEKYHENDIADALELLTFEERQKLYQALGEERVAEIFAYLDDAGSYLEELEPKQAAEIVEYMDSDDAVDVLEDIDEELQEKLVSLMDAESSKDIRLIRSYDEDEIGSKMTTNFIMVKGKPTVKQAMKELVSQAEENDNIQTIYFCKKDGTFYGAMDLKDLITAREYTDLQSLISYAYPFVRDHEKVSGCVGIALLAAMVISSMLGTTIPMFFHRIHIDPAVASGPLITTINDLVAVISY